MADEPVVTGTDAAASAADERTKNFSAEISRKLENTEKRLEDKITSLLSKIPQAKAAPAANVEEDLDDLLYSDPKRYAQVVREQAKREASQAAHSIQQSENQKNQVLGKLVADFPELRDQSSTFAKAALAEYESLPQTLQQDPVAYELAVSRAALKQGMRPISQRNNDDSFTVSSNSGNRPTKSASKKDDDLDAVLAVAELFGKDIKDPEYLKSIKGHMKRDYHRYREPKPVKE